MVGTGVKKKKKIPKYSVLTSKPFANQSLLPLAEKAFLNYTMFCGRCDGVGCQENIGYNTEQ